MGSCGLLKERILILIPKAYGTNSVLRVHNSAYSLIHFRLYSTDCKNENLYFGSHQAQICCGGPIPLTAPSKTWVCGCSLAGIAGSNPARDMDVCLL